MASRRVVAAPDSRERRIRQGVCIPAAAHCTVPLP